MSFENTGVGLWVGLWVGARVGLVGLLVGLVLGSFVGDPVGAVGAFVVGTLVGAAALNPKYVGTLVGAAVTTTTELDDTVISELAFLDASALATNEGPDARE